MYCSNCGSQVIDGARFCPKCGSNIDAAENASSNANAYQSLNQDSNPGLNPGYYPSQYVGPVPAPGTLYQQKLAQATREGFGMNWYKFVIYVQCILGFVGGIASGIVYIMGLQYGDNASLIYGFYSGLKIVDVAYGIINILTAILLIYVRFGLKRFKTWAVGLYLLFYPLAVVSFIFYRILTCAVLGTSPFEQTTIVTLVIYLVVYIAFYYLNYVYFGHRRHLFTEA